MAVRILVTGSRTWEDIRTIDSALTQFIGERIDKGDREFIIVNGDCPRGADKIANEWVKQLGPLLEKNEITNEAGVMVGAECWPAEWHGRGNRAGTDRNELMVHLGADVCLAFIKDGSSGATHCANYAEKHGIETRRFVA